MGMFGYLGSLIKTDTGNSSKSFTLVLSAIISFISGLVMCFVITYDVITNGYVKTDLESAGIFMLCCGAFMAGGSVSKIFGDRVARYNHEYEDYDVPQRSVRNKRKRSRKANVEDEEMDLTDEP